MSGFLGQQNVQQQQSSKPAHSSVSSGGYRTSRFSTTDHKHLTSDEAIEHYVVPETEPVKDVDTPYESDPAFCACYANDIHTYQRQLEVFLLF